ncbi:Uncharacterised protein [Streptococcus pneumoniae]|nr:Uncharacterised protein [Streptococcus pneumoniae]
MVFRFGVNNWGSWYYLDGQVSQKKFRQEHTLFLPEFLDV